uniref:Serine protease n=1 Tax=Riboviria sp. TaxID=2585031 RepID=A0A8K1U3A9_9VIRU|nr:MAG: hypothetical protein 1 [Riboviria sp.]
MATVAATVTYPIARTYLAPAPVPQGLVSNLGGLVTGCLKGIGSVPYVKEAAYATGLILTVFVARRSRKVREAVDDGVWRLKERIGMKMIEKPSGKVNSIIPESIRDNSHELETAMPKIQVKVGKVVDGEFVVFGSAVRIADAIVVPAHVIISASDDNGNVWLKGSQSVIRFSSESFELIETDLMARNTQSEEFSRIGMPHVRLAECLGEKGEFVSVCGIAGKGTVGRLKHDPTSFGKVMYSGTTMPGYSGAPYTIGNAVSGIHCWGGKINGGYSASYVKVLVQKQLGRVDETEIWLMEKFQKKCFKKADIKFNPGNDEAWIRYEGKYHLVSGETFRKARGFDYLEDFENHDSTRVGESVISGESNSLTLPGASGNVSDPGQLELLAIKQLTRQLQQLMEKQKKNLKPSAEPLKLEPSTSGLLSEQKRK